MHVVDLGDILRVLFYLWLLTSLGVYGYRMYRRVTMSEDEREERAERKAAAKAARVAAKGGTPVADDEDGEGAGATPASKAPGAGPKAAAATDGKAGARSGVSATSTTRINRRGIDRSEEKLVEGSLVDQVIREELEARRRAEGTSGAGPDADVGGDGDAPAIAVPAATGTATAGRKGLFAPLPTGADPDADDRPTVAEALEGIALPCDLVPLIGDTEQLDPHHVVFVTTGHPAREVGARFADELERLGFTMGTAAETTATATRGNVVVTVELHEDASTVRDGDERRFPTAPGGSVAVELLT